MTDTDVPKAELLLYQTEDGRTRVECRYEGETLWLTQALMADLFQTTPQNITQHLRELYADGGSSKTQPVSRSYKFGRRAGARCATASRKTRSREPSTRRSRGRSSSSRKRHRGARR